MTHRHFSYLWWSGNLLILVISNRVLNKIYTFLFNTVFLLNKIAFFAKKLRNGGYPEIIKARNLTKSYLSTLFDSILLKDVAKRHKVRNTSDLYHLATYLLANFCNPISANELASALGLSSVATTKKFCDYLAESYLFFFLPRFNNMLKLIKKTPRKVYVVDNGFVQSTGFNLSENLGRLLENQVFVELMRQGYEPGNSLFYYRTRNDKEINFVARKGIKVEQLIQVCYDISNEKTRKRELNALVEAAEELHCDNLQPEQLAFSLEEAPETPTTMKLNDESEEKAKIVKALESCGYRREPAAAILGISRRNLFQKMKDYCIEVPKRHNNQK